MGALQLAPKVAPAARGAVAARSFEDWSMGFISLDAALLSRGARGDRRWELAMLLEGIDAPKVRRRKRYVLHEKAAQETGLGDPV